MEIVGSKRYGALAALAAGVAVLAVVGAASARTHGASGAAASTRGAARVALRATSFGKVLVDARGRTLYLYTRDGKNTSSCYGRCASLWPPLLTAGKPSAGRGVKASLLGVTMRENGSHQVTYRGHPLYLFASDRKAGQVNGEGVQKVWWVVSAKGAKVTRKPTPRATSATTIQLRRTSLGMILVDSHGKTLYLYTPDRSPSSTCYGQCASFWPPLLAHGRPTVGAGLKASLLGTTKRTDGTTQVTYDGHPLYTYARDSKAGDTQGEDVQGIWYAVSAAGAKVEPRGTPATTTTTQAPGYGGGGY